MPAPIIIAATAVVFLFFGLPFRHEIFAEITTQYDRAA
jgi:hypothetical protein